MWSLATSLSWTSLALGYYLSSILAKIVNVITGKGSLFHGLGDACLKIGFSGIPKALQDLKDSALQGPLLPIAQDKLIKVLEEEDDELLNQGTNFEGEKGTGLLDSTPINSAGYGPKPGVAALDQRKEKSLGLLTRNFVKLFITTDVIFLCYVILKNIGNKSFMIGPKTGKCDTSHQTNGTSQLCGLKPGPNVSGSTVSSSCSTADRNFFPLTKLQISLRGYAMSSSCSVPFT
ncbi:E2F transcription factor-like E2FE isoform X3 [Carex littledalei]|uniref:E2F transcription factor-like E2FE isoform X3 n=1 Tax=Carex littledalei TaxID=544730 RepID=A0A833R2F0_9POAL|nr:E2F transcription factor-like E2FE isoform X3 [Carex littledalei]